VGGGIFRKALALGGVGAAEGAALGSGEAEAGERGAGAVLGGLAGGVVGAGAGVLFPVLGGLSRMLRSDKALAKVVARETVEQTGRTAEDLFDAVRVRQLDDFAPKPAVLADVDPALAQQAERFATGGNAQLRRAEGPLDALRARVRPEAIRSAQAQVYAPFDGSTSKSRALISQLTKNDEILDATRRVIPGEPKNIMRVKFEQLQSIRNGLKNQFKAAKAQGDVSKMNKIAQTRIHFDEQIETAFPGFRTANDQMIELLARQDGAEELIRAIDKALPQIQPDVPQVGGMFSSTYKAVARPARRRKLIMEMVGEALLDDGEAGIRQLEDLVRDGTIAKMFRGIGNVRNATRGGALAVPGLLTTDQ
jgi:gas vesicle protein